MDNRSYIKELEATESIKKPDFLEGVAEGLNAAFYIAQESGIDLHDLPKFVELQDFVLKRLKDS